MRDSLIFTNQHGVSDWGNWFSVLSNYTVAHNVSCQGHSGKDNCSKIYDKYFQLSVLSVYVINKNNKINSLPSPSQTK